MSRPLAFATVLALLPLPLGAQTVDSTQAQAGAEAQAQSGQPPKRIRSVTLTDNQACPKPTNPNEEIVVCARVGEPYRIPKELREDKPTPAQNQSWVNRAALADEVGRRAAGLPDTCSPTGTGGQSGCARLRAERYTAEKKAAAREKIVEDNP